MLIQILPKFDYRFDAAAMTMFLKTLSGIRVKDNFKTRWHILMEKGIGVMDYQFIIDCDGEAKERGMISFYFQVNDSAAPVVLNALENMVQDKADIFPLDRTLETYTTVHTLYCNEEQSANNEKKTIACLDDQSFLFVLASLRNKTRITIDFNIKRTPLIDNKLAFLKKGGGDVSGEAIIKVSAKTKYQRNELMEITNTIIALSAGQKELKARYRDVYRSSTFSGSELMDFIRLPSFDRKAYDLDIIQRIYKLESGQRTLKENEFASGIKCGKVFHPMQDRDVFINELQARKHMFITGQTGSGKSSAAEEMMRALLLRKAQGKPHVPGFTFFDPAETSVLGVIDMILKLQADGYDVEHLLKHTHYIDFGYEDCIFPISLLSKDIPSTEILDFFKELFGDMATIQVDRLVTSAINALLMDNQPHTIMDIPRLFQDDNMREELTLNLSRNIYAADVVAFLKRKFNQQQLEPILNRMDPFMNTNHKKLMFGLPDSYSGLRKIHQWIDQGDIILCNLKGLNDNDRRIIVGYMALKYYLYGLHRSDNALLHLTYMDESHKLQFNILQRWLAELRKGGMALVPMTQYLDQYNPEYLQALLGNVGTKMTFRQGDDGARRLINNLPGNLDRDALKRLPDMRGFLSTEDGKEIKSILVKVDPPYRYNDGLPVPHPDPDNKQTMKNIQKNRKLARELMMRDFITRKDAERIVFKQHFDQQEEIDIENELIEEGDAMWDE